MGMRENKMSLECENELLELLFINSFFPELWKQYILPPKYVQWPSHHAGIDTISEKTPCQIDGFLIQKYLIVI